MVPMVANSELPPGFSILLEAVEDEHHPVGCCLLGSGQR
jgi:hypothetical protein